MRINVKGECESAKVLRGYLTKAGLALSEHSFGAGFVVYVEEWNGANIVCDSVDSPLESHLLTCISELTEEDIILRRRKGDIHRENEIKLLIPKDDKGAMHAAEVGLLRGLQRAHSPRRSWLGSIFILTAVLLIPSILCATPPNHSRISDRYTAREIAETFENPQGITPIYSFQFDGSSNLKVNCTVGCSAGASFSDNAAFTVSTSSINVMGGYFTSGADPTLTSGSAARVRIDTHSYLDVDCIVGCSGGATTPADAFANPTTAGLQFGLLSGYNGATWDRLRSTITNGLQVDVTRVQGSVAVTGTFFQGTQPVSLASLPTLPSGTNVIGHVIADTGSTTAVTGNVTAVQATGSNLHVVVDTAPTTAVTGTFFQSTQPVSCASGATCPVNATIQNASLPVTQSGAWTDTVTQATGANLHVNVDSAPTTAVTGTFFQGTQPVSIASMPSTPVTGTFYQSIQPVSGSVAVTGGNIKIANTPLQPVPVSVMSTMYVAVLSNGTIIPVQLLEGQSTMSQSLPVVIASDQGSIPVKVSTLPALSGTGPDGQTHTVATDGGGNVFYIPAGLPRQSCNAVRKTNCQP